MQTRLNPDQLECLPARIIILGNTNTNTIEWGGVMPHSTSYHHPCRTTAVKEVRGEKIVEDCGCEGHVLEVREQPVRVIPPVVGSPDITGRQAGLALIKLQCFLGRGWRGLAQQARPSTQ